MTANPPTSHPPRKPWWRRPPWRTFLLIGSAAIIVTIAYTIWSPGQVVTDGRHDRGRNAIWLQHGWLADDSWFARNGGPERAAVFRSPEAIAVLIENLKRNHITDLFPHVSPMSYSGHLPPVDHDQVERFLDAADGLRVFIWSGGVLDLHARPDDAGWRARAVQSIAQMLDRHPRLAGVQINIEPCPSGHEGFLLFLDELRAALPEGKLLSVAAYPPPTWVHRYPEVHWDRKYFGEVARRTDQMAVMMYDTSLRLSKPYVSLMADWTREAIAWAGDTPVLLGVPTYDDADSGYHHPSVEHLPNALAGIHAGLFSLSTLPVNYQGVAIYCEWETDADEWEHWSWQFLHR